MEILCSALSAIAAIICALIAKENKKLEAKRKADEENEKKLNEQRLKEAKLQLSMIAANSKLTVGVAMALKHGHANGEVEDGLKAVEEANGEYTRFLEELAIENIKGK